MRPTATLVQRRATDVRLFGAAGYALALQLGHPTIAAGVRHHSNFTADPWGRLVGTVDFVNLLVYGTPDQTSTATRNLRAAHARIRGTDAHGHRYTALDPQAYAWVHATLADAIVRGHQVFGTALNDAQKDRFWREWMALGAQMGVRPAELPATWVGFCDYRRDVIDNLLEHNDMIEVAQDVAADASGGSPLPWLPPRVWAIAGRPLGRYGAFLARGMMGARVREKFQVPWSAQRQRAFVAIAAAHRAAGPVMPPPLRHAGPAVLKLRRREIAQGPFA
ncbi:MAG TPA: oxygenase MpaB family protein [Acidimicrobiales bacterium]|nr:oxygenase MpaB family protein [Acidimicrobiales bacterium]